MKVSTVMSSPVITAAPDTPIKQAASLMREHDVGVLPVQEKGRAIGIVTDRDLVIAVLARSENTGGRPVCDAMSPNPISCREVQSTAEAAALMSNAQVERLLVLDQEDRLMGIITVGDIAVHASELLAGQTVGEICEDRKSSEQRRR